MVIVMPIVVIAVIGAIANGNGEKDDVVAKKSTDESKQEKNQYQHQYQNPEIAVRL
jgi:hypothetical protein